MDLKSYSSLDDLPGTYTALFDGADSFFQSREWFQALASSILDARHRLTLIGLEDGGTTRLLFVGREAAGAGPFLRTLSSLTNFYSMETSILADGIDPVAALPKLLDTLRPRYDSLKIDVLKESDATVAALLDGLRATGWHVTTQPQSRTWSEPFNGVSYEQYKRKLPSGIRRLDRKFDENPHLSFALVTTEDELENAFRAYDAVYSKSWKEPEIHAAFMPTLLRHLARAGALRLGLLYVQGQPVAAQVWVVSGRRATIYKIAYDEQFKKLGVGSMLLLRMFRRVVDDDGVAEVNFGLGDDGYKQTWMSHAIQVHRLEAFNTRTFRGACATAAHRARHRFKALSG